MFVRPDGLTVLIYRLNEAATVQIGLCLQPRARGTHCLLVRAVLNLAIYLYTVALTHNVVGILIEAVSVARITL